MLEWLQSILGDVYTEELDKKLSEEIGKRFVSKTDFTAKNEAVKNLSQRLADANAQIESFQDMDVEAIKQNAEEWKRKAEQAEQEAEARVREIEHDSLLREKLAGIGFTSDYAKQGVFNDIKAKNLPVNNGSLTGFDEALKSIKEAEPMAFVPDNPAPQFSTGVTPPTGSSGMKFNFTGVREKTKN